MLQNKTLDGFIIDGYRPAQVRKLNKNYGIDSDRNCRSNTFYVIYHEKFSVVNLLVGRLLEVLYKIRNVLIIVILLLSSAALGLRSSKASSGEFSKSAHIFRAKLVKDTRKELLERLDLGVSADNVGVRRDGGLDCEE